MLRNVSTGVLESSALAQLGELSLFFSGPIGDEIVANNVSVGQVGIPLLNEGIRFEEVGHADVEFLHRGWGDRKSVV